MPWGVLPRKAPLCSCLCQLPCLAGTTAVVRCQRAQGGQGVEPLGKEGQH